MQQSTTEGILHREVKGWAVDADNKVVGGLPSLRACPYQPNVICQRKRCYINCPYRIKQIRKHTKYTLPICTLPQPCKYKGQDKKTKLPICKFYDKQTGQLLPCNNQLIISKAWITRHKPDIETLRKLWWKYKKAGVI